MTFSCCLAQNTAPVRITGRHLYVIVRRDTAKVEQRGEAGSAGVAFKQLILTPDTDYRIWLLQTSTLLTGYVDIRSPPNGRTLSLPNFLLGTDLSADRDGDGMGEDAEFIVGTSPTNPDTDGDGVNDGAEVRQGTDPLSGRAVRTGIVGTATINGTAVDISAANDLAIIACSDRGISVFNVFSGMNPAIVAQVDTPGDARRVAIAGKLVAVADGAAGLAIIDVTDPPAASIIRQISVGTAQSVALAGSVAFVGLTTSQIVAVDVRSGTELGRILNLPGSVEDLILSGDYLYAATSDKIHVVSLLDGDFKLLASVNSPIVSTGSRRMTAGGGILYVVHGKGYNTFNLNIPALPVLIRAGNTTQFGWKQIAPTGSGLAVAAVDANFALDGSNDVSLYNVADPANVNNFITTFATPGLARSLSIYNGLAYVADSPAGLQVVNYLAYDALGKPPTISLNAAFPLNPAQAEEGKLAWVEAKVTDDVQVRNVEFYVDGQKIETDGNFPFEFRFFTPRRSGQKNSFTLRARASDTGGNATWSTEYVVNLVADATPPRVTRTQPLPGSISGSVDSIVASFSEPIDLATLSEVSFKVLNAGLDGLFGTADDSSVTGGALSYQEGINTASLRFTAPLPAGDYQGVVGAPLADRVGNPMVAAYRWRFRVFDRADLDHDGVPDELEKALGLDPTKSDTNNNGILDGDEDFDRDGLSNSLEILLGSDPSNPRSIDPKILDGDLDRDGDMLPDRKEILIGTNPLVADSDRDGWNDESEVTGGSDPLGPKSTPPMRVVGSPMLKIGLAQFSLAGRGAGVTVGQPPLKIGLASYSGEFVNGVVMGQPPIKIGLPAFAEGFATGVVVGQPSVRIGLPVFSEDFARGNVVGQPPLRIGLTTLSDAQILGVTVALPPVRVKILPQ